MLVIVFLIIATFTMTVGTFLLFLALRHWRHLPHIKRLGAFIFTVSVSGGLLCILSVGLAVTGTPLPIVRLGISIMCTIVGIMAGIAAWRLETGIEGGSIKERLSKAWNQIKRMLRK